MILYWPKAIIKTDKVSYTFNTDRPGKWVAWPNIEINKLAEELNQWALNMYKYGHAFQRGKQNK